MIGIASRTYLIRSAAAGVALAVTASATPAATKDWSATATSSAWTNGGNWVGGAPANDLLTDIARFNQLSYAFQPNAGTNSVNGLEIGDGTVATANLNIAGTSLSIGGGGITKFANSGVATLATPVIVGAAQAWTNHSGALLTQGASVNTNANTLTIGGAGNITVTGVVGGGGALVKTGSGILTLTAKNTFTGGLTIKAGTVIGNGSSANSGQNFGATTNAVTLGDTAAGATADASLVLAGFGAPTIASPITVAAGTSGTLSLINNSDGVSGANGAYILNGSLTLNHDLVLRNNGTTNNADHFLALNGVISGAGSIHVYNEGGTDAINDVRSRVAIGSGPNNSGWTGNLYVHKGLFRLGSSNTAFSAANTFYLGQGSVTDYNVGLATIAGLNDIDGAGGIIDNSHSNAARNVIIGGSGNYSFSGVIQNTKGGAATATMGVIMNGSGTQALNQLNTYGGVTTLNAGTLSVNVLANGGSASGIGQSSSAATNLLFHGGTLKYTGTGASSDRLFSLGKTGGTLDASGTGALLLTHSGPTGTYVVASDANFGDITGTLTLTGINTAANTLAAAVADPSGTGITGTTSLAKTGVGTWVLTGTSTYTGPTTVSAGTLVIDGSLASAVTVNGGTLRGSGTTGGLVTIGSGGATLAPGSSPGVLTLAGGVAFTDATSHLDLDLAGTSAGAEYDQLRVTGGSIALAGATLNVFLDGYEPLIGDSFLILDNQTAGGIGGTFSGLAEGATFDLGNTRLQISYVGGDGNDIILNAVAIPEPGALALAGLFGLLAGRRRRS